MLETPRLITKDDVSSLTSLSNSNIDRLEKAAKFPRRLRLSSRRVAWRYDEVIEWIEQRAAHSSRYGA